MKKVIVSLVVFFGAVGLAAGGSLLFAEEAQIATRATPTASSFTVTSGSTMGASLNLLDAKAFRVSVCTVDNVNLGATGSLKAYLLDNKAGLVLRDPSLDLTITGGTPCQVFPDQSVLVPYDNLIYATSSLTTTDGGTLLQDAGTAAFKVYYRGFKSP